MRLDYTTLLNREVKSIDFVKNLTLDDLRKATNDSIDFLLHVIADLDDDDVTFDPIDPEANDPYAAPGEEHIGWSIAHVIAHITASSEEGAAFSSLLARGIPAKERPRYEVSWREVKTKAQCVQRLEESRRIRLAYLATWPDNPHLDVYREVSERFEEKLGKMNAPAAFIFGLSHEVGHYDQIREARRQALAAKQAVART